MKKAVSIMLCIFTLLLFCNCGTKESETMQITYDRNVTVVNGINEADIWILPKTEENLKTTLWGTATAGKMELHEIREVPVAAPSDNGLYIFRMIDTDKMYYSAEDIVIEDGWTLEIKGDINSSIVIEVTDKDHQLNATYEVFAAKL